MIDQRLIEDLVSYRLRRITYGSGKHRHNEVFFEIVLANSVGGEQFRVSQIVDGMRSSGSYYPITPQGQSDMMQFLGLCEEQVNKPLPDHVKKRWEIIRGKPLDFPTLFYMGHERACLSTS